MLSDDERLNLHLAQEYPSRWSGMILDMAGMNSAKALYAADLVRTKEIEDGFPKSALCLIATTTIRQIEMLTKTNGPSRITNGEIRSAEEFYRSPLSWGVVGGLAHTPKSGRRSDPAL